MIWSVEGCVCILIDWLIDWSVDCRITDSFEWQIEWHNKHESNQVVYDIRCVYRKCLTPMCHLSLCNITNMEWSLTPLQWRLTSRMRTTKHHHHHHYYFFLYLRLHVCFPIIPMLGIWNFWMNISWMIKQCAN